MAMMPKQSPASRLRRFAIWSAIGAGNTAWGLGLILLLHQGLGVGVVLSNLITYLLGALSSYWLNQRFTFRRGSASVAQFTRFVVGMGAAFTIAMTMVLGLLVAGVPYLVAQVGATVTYALVFFLIADRRIFRQQPPPSHQCQDSATPVVVRITGDVQATPTLPADLHRCPWAQ
ncbi:MAG TPA: GtrA family protein [Planctomycetota bacterium]|nr:GtrA family protein [Planctomycetota bacterium]